MRHSSVGWLLVAAFFVAPTAAAERSSFDCEPEWRGWRELGPSRASADLYNSALWFAGTSAIRFGAEDPAARWTRVNDLPDYVYFNHSIHLAKGVGCVSCHGRVDKMPLLYQAESMQMEWCLDCHREPEKYLRPKEALFDMAWEPQPGTDLRQMGAELAAEYHAEPSTSCSRCHR